MKDKLGQIWLILLVVFIIGLSIALWWTARRRALVTNIDYLTYEAGRILGCPAYPIGPDLAKDLNQNGQSEYLFSCDSSLAQPHKRFVVLEVLHKKPTVLLHFAEGQWLAGEGPAMDEAYWLLDRRQRILLLSPIKNQQQTETLWQMIWKSKGMAFEEE